MWREPLGRSLLSLTEHGVHMHMHMGPQAALGWCLSRSLTRPPPSFITSASFAPFMWRYADISSSLLQSAPSSYALRASKLQGMSPPWKTLQLTLACVS